MTRRTITPQELATILAAHREWRRGAGGSRAYLGGADLGGADLRGADLRGADLREAYLGGADLGGADLREAYLRGAYLRGADLSEARGIPSREEAMALLDEIRTVVLADEELLQMSVWHADDSRPHDCGTAHCMAGWAQALRKLPTVEDGVVAIWPAAHMVYENNDVALEYLREREYAADVSGEVAR